MVASRTSSGLRPQGSFQHDDARSGRSYLQSVIMTMIQDSGAYDAIPASRAVLRHTFLRC